jgi:pyruvate-formate lyase
LHRWAHPDGQDATNQLSYLCLEATRLVQSPHTNLSARFHDDTPEAFHRACFEVIRTGIGFPAVFNDHVLLAGLEEIGIPAPVARDYCMVGCIETMLPGRQPAWSDSRFNTPLYLLKALDQVAAEGSPSYDRVVAQFRLELACAIREHVEMINAYIIRFPPDQFPDPFLSAVTRDCIARARDVNNGGAQFPRFHGIAVMGLATLADSLAAVKKLVFDEGRVSLTDLMAALKNDFAGAEPLRQALLNRAPKYGNDDPYVDQIAAQIVLWTSEECLKHTVVGGGRFVSAMAANVQNISAGREVGATPDGRRAFTPLSDAASPYFGRDLHGPTAFLRSVAVAGLP